MKNSLRISIGIKAVKNVYQLESNLMYSQKLHSYSRESNTSIASGIYEEIKDNIYSPEPKALRTNKDPCNLQMEPPELPPRQKQRPERDRYDCNFI